jgi:putative heme iron utilization protein
MFKDFTCMTEVNAPRPAAEFDPVVSARELLRRARRASLATSDCDGGRPYVSLIAVASDEDGAPLMLVSNLARHTQNLSASPDASVLAADVGAGDPLAHARVTLFGSTIEVDKEAKKARWLARQPESAMYFDFGDFRMLRLEPEGAHLVAGFGRIVDLDWAELRTETSGAEKLFEAEAGIVEHMNEDHADATRLFATKLLGAEDGDWRFEGCDSLGCEIGLSGQALYLPFPEPVATAGDVRKALVALVAEARARP